MLRKLNFHWHYNILEATVKNAYILQSIDEISEKQKIRRVLDMGCGNGHVSKFIVQSTGADCVGFDPNINIKTKLSIFKFNLKNKIRKKNGRITVYKMNHIAFFNKNQKEKFDVIVDNCSVTHFDTKASGEINLGWVYMVNHLRKILKDDGYFISSTDVVFESKVNYEFLLESDIIKAFLEKGWKIENINKINQPQEFDCIASNFSGFMNLNFLRVPPPNTAENRALGIMGFNARYKDNSIKTKK
jgi:SAM-dependent methyltransferase